MATDICQWNLARVEDPKLASSMDVSLAASRPLPLLWPQSQPASFLPERCGEKPRTAVCGLLACGALCSGLWRAEVTRKRLLARAIAWDAKLGCAYVPDLLPEDCFKDILDEYHGLHDRLAEEGPCVARGRRVITRTEGTAWQVFRSHWLRLHLQTRAFLPFYPYASPCPMEYREYRKGSSMLWHKDTILTEPPQLELVYTLENTSDSVTRFATSHLDVLHRKVQELWTAPNSALLLKAHTALLLFC